ncbi:hypothetical protein A0128_21230 [Leptospira tipperaryensis]|uniref:Tetrapyrrole biosynthesis uroporphyrinogen III synthase domain-containing protein n=1 Tax=Leptospira tipperaryensis TaxID=2564040 RepID=A0A1D7V3W7_9LEPT|nr:uroporphyrinogen-III synthase [Leptospira tipperaryensis]AOP36534.1 hypothetical protein A0128_21230 [Leptospira tipperaryensis]
MNNLGELKHSRETSSDGRDVTVSESLQGISVLIVRSRSGPSRLSKILKEQGAIVLEAPSIEVEAIEENIFDYYLQSISYSYNIIFSCKEGIGFFLKALAENRKTPERLRTHTLIAFGEDVSKTLNDFGLTPDHILSGHCKEAIEQKLEIFSSGKNLVITSERGRPNLKTFFQELKIESEFLPCYRYVPRFQETIPPNVHYVIVPSSSSVSLLKNCPWGESMKDVPWITLGPITRKSAEDFQVKTIFTTASDRLEEVLPLLLQLKDVSR